MAESARILLSALLLFLHFRQQCCVVDNDYIGDQSRAITPDLLLCFRLNLELPAIDE